MGSFMRREILTQPTIARACPARRSHHRVDIGQSLFASVAIELPSNVTFIMDTVSIKRGRWQYQNTFLRWQPWFPTACFGSS
jgi:hypothetical protein